MRHGEGGTAEVAPPNWKRGHSWVPLPATGGIGEAQWKSAELKRGVEDELVYWRTRHSRNRGDVGGERGERLASFFHFVSL